MNDLECQKSRKKKIRIGIARFWEGATCEQILDILMPPSLRNFYDFDIVSSPEIVLFGPYNGQMPKGQYKRVFIGCENIRPIMSECDWAFGVQHEETIEDPRYMRIKRWGDRPQYDDNTRDYHDVVRSKKRFCIFLYSQPSHYREAFFRALSRYKHVDAPGRSMNNMGAIDSGPSERNWRRKIEVLREYKFVIAFENSTFPGYNTEKLAHAVEADSLPIYWGDPQIDRCFNARRFINAFDYVPRTWPKFPRLPHFPHSIRKNGPSSLASRISRRLNSMLAESEQRIWAWRGFDALVEQVVRVDKDDELYVEYLQQPFLNKDEFLEQSAWISRWRNILDCV
jgi:hypothetical protein